VPALHLASVLAAGLLLAACGDKPAMTDKGGSPGDSGSTDTGGDTGATATLSLTCQELRSGKLAEGSPVTLEEVIVTSPLLADGSGFFVQDPGGGLDHGLFVDVDAVADPVKVAPGDVLQLSGQVGTVDLGTALVLALADDLVQTGTATPTVTPVDESAPASDYDAVLVSLDAPTFMACPDDQGRVQADDGHKLGSAFFPLDADRNSHADQATGIMMAPGGDGAFVLEPRSLDDLAGLTRGDGCSWTIPALNQALSTAVAQHPDADLSFDVSLPPAVVTSALSTSDLTGLFVQELDSGSYGGLFVDVPGSAYDESADLQPGAMLTLSGTATLHSGMVWLEVPDLDHMVLDGTGADPSRVTVTTLTTEPDDWTPWVGQLVQLRDPTADHICPGDWRIHPAEWLTSFDDACWETIVGEVGYSLASSGVCPSPLGAATTSPCPRCAPSAGPI